MNKTLKITLSIVLSVIILVLAYFVFESIMNPVRFKRINEKRRTEVIARLKDIREIQRYYKQENGAYASGFSTLLKFAETGRIPIVRIIPDPADTTNRHSIKDTIGFVSVRDSLFRTRENFSLSDIQYVPYSNQTKFEMGTSVLDRGGVKVSTFEAKTLNTTFLTEGMEQYRQNLINMDNALEQLDKYPGLKVGSLTEVSTDGNWE